MNPWNDLFSQVEQTYVRTSRLLKDAEGMLVQRGFRSIEEKGTAVGSQGSASLDHPEWWFYGWVSRFYEFNGGSVPHSKAHVGVLFYNRRDDNMPLPYGPVVTAGRWDFHEPSGSWRYWLAKAWAWGDDAADGTVVVRRVGGHGVNVTGKVFAVPLESITCPDDLDRLVITPLVDLFKE